MAEEFWNLVVNVGGSILRRRKFDVPPDPPVLPIAQMRRWLPDEDPLPSFDDNYQSLAANVPIAGSATEVDYIVVSQTLVDLQVAAIRDLGIFTITRLINVQMSLAMLAAARLNYIFLLAQIAAETDPAVVAVFDPDQGWPAGSVLPV